MSQSGILNVSGGGGGGSPIETITGNDGVATTPLGNNVNILGLTVANATNAIPVYVKHTAAATDSIEVQVSEAVGSSNVNNAGLASFNSAQFSVDANGYVSSLGSSTDLHVARYIVSAGGSTDGANYTSLATAYAAAVAAGAPQTVFIQPGTYTLNQTLVPGINICAFDCDAFTPNVTIVGTLTLTTAGSVSISGVRLQTNGAALLAVTGSAASIVNLNNCYLNCTNSTGITFSTSSGSAQINITNCMGDLGTTGIGLFTHTSAGTILISNSRFTNSGASTTASTASAGGLNFVNARFQFPITTSATNGGTWEYSIISTAGQNVTAATFGGTTQSNKWCRFDGGSASAVSIGTTAGLEHCTVSSSNTNTLTGAGTLTYSFISFDGSSSGVNTTTLVPLATLI